MSVLAIPVRLLRGTLPERATAGASGYDLQWQPEPGIEKVILGCGLCRLFETGIRLEIPYGYEGQIRPRSGWALNSGVTVLNAPGTIDSDYRGEVRVLLINHGRNNVEVTPGMRIAQLVICPVGSIPLIQVVTLNETTRGDGGFGSTGA